GGTNEFSGNLFGFIRHKSIQARNAFAPIIDGDPDKKPPYTRVQYGFTFGGPLVKDRMFFFTSFEQRRRQESGFFTSDVIGDLTASTGIDQIIIPIPTGGNFIVSPSARNFDRITAAQAAYINSTIATGLVLVQNPATFQQGISALCIARTYAFFASSGGNTGLFGANPLFSPNDGSNCPAISPILPSANPVGPRFLLSGMPVPLT